MTKRIGKRDIIFILVSLCISIVIAILFFFFRDNGAYVVIEKDGKTYGIYDLNTDQSIEVINDEKVVTNVILIENGSASVIEANCPDLLCVHQRSITKENESIICLPNKVVIYIPSKDNSSFDGIAQ